MARTMQGKEVDMEKLVRQHELMPAVGNVRVNARGDELGPGGKIVKKHEDIIAEYYKSNPKAKSEIAPVKTKADKSNVTVKDNLAVTNTEEQVLTKTDETVTTKRTK